MKLRISMFSLALLSAPLFVAQAQNACVQVIQPAVSPDGICQEYSTPCDVPEDWKSVPSCDLIDVNEDANKPSLEQKMHTRLAQMRAYWKMKKAEENSMPETSNNETFNRIGSGNLTRNDRNRRLPTSEDSKTKGVKRTFTDKNYDSVTAERYNVRGGYQRPGDTTSAERKERRQSRAAFQSRSDANRSGNLNTTIKWSVLSDQFTTRKNYGVNPYQLKSQYQKQQAAKRAATNREVDVHQRMMSRSRKYRGERLEGNLSGDALLDR